jgi:predicted signal transduction protein with EAL and GGDEF domain
VATLVPTPEPNAVLDLLGASLASRAQEPRALGVLLVQITNYDRVAAVFGLRAAHELAVAVAERLQRVAKPTDRIVQVTDAKFVVVVDPARNQGVLVLAANRIVETLGAPIRVGDANVNALPRIGIATAPTQADASLWLQHAEAALLSAAADAVAYAFFTPALAGRAADSLGLELELESAIKRNELEVYYQPKVSAATLEPCGAEALLRWTSATRGRVSPDVFVPLADQPGLIEPLTAFVLNTALRQSRAWPARWGPLAVAVNVTPRVIEGGELNGLVASALSLWDAAPQRLFVEITEGAIMRNPQASFAVLRELREQGVRISIDDFGTGYSSLAYFKNIPADELKIDKSFVMKMLHDNGDRKIVRAIMELAKSFGLKVTAEGVEDAATALALAELDCDTLQGYHYSPPLPNAKFVAWLEDYRVEGRDRRHG